MAVRIKLTTSSVFNRDLLCDVTIKFGARQIKCHRLILCNVSDYFNAICGQNSRWKEANSGVIELKDNDPDAVEAMLRYIYGFDYPTIEKTMTKTTDVTFHLNVYITANQYMLRELRGLARGALLREIRAIETHCQQTHDAKKVFKVIQLLLAHRDYFEGVQEVVAALKRDHMAALFKLKEFRASLDAGEEDGFIQQLVEIFQHRPRVSVDISLMQTKFTKCEPCGMMWSYGRVTRCANCGNRDKSRIITVVPDDTQKDG